MNEVRAQTNRAAPHADWEAPRVFVEYPTVPRPFDGVVAIEYEMPADGHVVIKLYDALEKEVRYVLDEYKKAGRYRFSVKVADLPRGLYYCKFATAHLIAVTRLLV